MIVIFFLTQGSFYKILACNLMRYCIYSPYCSLYVWFEHPGHTYGSFNFVFSEPGCDNSSCNREAVCVFNPRDSKVPLPPDWLQRSGWRVRLSVYTMQLLISNVFALLLISVVSDMSEFFLNHIRKIRPPSGFMWQSDMFYDTWDFASGWQQLTYIQLKDII
jgi:hypothetical protein